MLQPEYPLESKWSYVWNPASLPAVGTKQVGIERKHFTLSRGNDNTALHSYIITFLLFTDTPHHHFFSNQYTSFQKWLEVAILTRAETVKSLACIFSVSQSTFLLVFRKITACVMVSVSYRSQRVSSFHSWTKQRSSGNTWQISTLYKL